MMPTRASKLARGLAVASHRSPRQTLASELPRGVRGLAPARAGAGLPAGARSYP